MSNARLDISRLRDGVPVAQSRSETVLESSLRWGSKRWEELPDNWKLLSMGGVEIPPANLHDDVLYLVTVKGGSDRDYDEDGVPDPSGQSLLGEWHALLTGAHLRQPLVHISALTESLYQAVLPEIEELDDLELKRRLDELASSVVTDINDDGSADYRDALAWSAMQHADQYLGAAVLLERVRYDVEFGLDATVLAMDGANAVTKSRWHPAVAEARYSQELVSCAIPVLYRDLCTLRTLPLLGANNRSPAVEDVMSRVVVSHDWMATRFEQVLREMPDDVLLLMRSLTGIVIGADVRPSYYQSANAMMYLDAEHFWLTEDERSTVSSQEDFRAEFGRQFAFADLWRYVLDSKSAFRDTDEVDEAGARQLSQIEKPAAALLFHELAHANDHIPSSIYQKLDRDRDIYSQLFVLPSDRLNADIPLESAELLDLASALYLGATPTEAEKAYKPVTIASFFEPDRASDLYAYASQYEDLAMLFEEFMMYHHYGLERDMAFTNVPAGSAEDDTCEDFIVQWGTRGRIAANQVLPRLGQVLRALLPGRDYSGQLQGLPGPYAMRSGEDWCENLRLDTAATNSRPAPAALKRPAPAPPRKPRPWL